MSHNTNPLNLRDRISERFKSLIEVYRGHTSPRCPECGSRKIGVVAKEPLGMRDVNYTSGSDGGGFTSVQVAYQVTTRCNACGAQWTTTLTETS